MYYPGGLLSWRVDGVMGERVDGVTGDSSRLGRVVDAIDAATPSIRHRRGTKEPEKPVIKLDQLGNVPLRRLHELHRVRRNRRIVGRAGLDLHDDAHQLVGLEAVFR